LNVANNPFSKVTVDNFDRRPHVPDELLKHHDPNSFAAIDRNRNQSLEIDLIPASSSKTISPQPSSSPSSDSSGPRSVNSHSSSHSPPVGNSVSPPKELSGPPHVQPAATGSVTPRRDSRSQRRSSISFGNLFSLSRSSTGKEGLDRAKEPAAVPPRSSQAGNNSQEQAVKAPVSARAGSHPGVTKQV
jgi:hypothetical protein